MRSTLIVKTVAEYDLLEGNTPTASIESYFAKPLATWDPSSLEPGEAESIQRAFVRNAATETIEIDREEHVVWVTYLVSVDMDYAPQSLDYFGASLESVLQNGCHVTFPLDERVVELVGDDTAVRLT